MSVARQQLERYRKKAAPDTHGHSAAGSETTAPAASSAAPEPRAPNVLPTQPPSPETLATQALPGAFLYAMRCPAHGRDIFKVGYTDRDPEARARELSASTSSATHFLLVQAWAVSEGLQAERAAHEQLAAYRLSTSREFFHAPYSELRKRIEGAIGPWSLE